MTLHQRLRAYWKSQGVAHRGGVQPSDIALFESQHGVSVPQDFRGFLLEFNGTTDMAGTDYFRFLALDELAPSTSSLDMPFGEPFKATYPHKPDGFFVFADYLQWCYGYAIQLTKGTPENAVVLIGGLTCPLVAHSFTEFMDLYLRDDPRLHPKASN